MIARVGRRFAPTAVKLLIALFATRLVFAATTPQNPPPFSKTLPECSLLAGINGTAAIFVGGGSLITSHILAGLRSWLHDTCSGGGARCCWLRGAAAAVEAIMLTWQPPHAAAPTFIAFPASLPTRLWLARDAGGRAVESDGEALELVASHCPDAHAEDLWGYQPCRGAGWTVHSCADLFGVPTVGAPSRPSCKLVDFAELPWHVLLSDAVRPDDPTAQFERVLRVLGWHQYWLNTVVAADPGGQGRPAFSYLTLPLATLPLDAPLFWRLLAEFLQLPPSVDLSQAATKKLAALPLGVEALTNWFRAERDALPEAVVAAVDRLAARYDLGVGVRLPGLPPADVEALRRAAAGGAGVLLAQANCGYLDFADNWAASLAAANLSNWVLLAEDGVVAAFVRAKYGPDHALELAPAAGVAGPGAGAHVFDTPAFNALVERRPALVEAVLAAGVGALWMDTDAVALASPLAFLPPGVPFAYQIDDPPGSGRKCTCLNWYAPGRAAAHEVLQAWARGFQHDRATHEGANPQDQTVLNHYVGGLIEDLRGSGAAFMFPHQAFPAGERTRHMTSPEEVAPQYAWLHANWLEGPDAKRELLRRTGQWRTAVVGDACAGVEEGEAAAGGRRRRGLKGRDRGRRIG